MPRLTGDSGDGRIPASNREAVRQMGGRHHLSRVGRVRFLGAADRPEPDGLVRVSTRDTTHRKLVAQPPPYGD